MKRMMWLLCSLLEISHQYELTDASSFAPDFYGHGVGSFMMYQKHPLCVPSTLFPASSPSQQSTGNFQL